MKLNSQNSLFLLAFIVLFSLFYGLALLTANIDWTWSRILICLVTVGGVIMAWTLLLKVPPVQSVREVGFVVPDWRGMGIAVAFSALLLSFFPIYAVLAHVQLTLQNNWPWILVGLFTGVGIAEETLFRGFGFGFLRRKNSFWRAATQSMLLFGAMHFLLLLWLPLPVAVAAIILSILAAYPMAYLFENSNCSIWPSAILHTTAVVTNLFVIPPDFTVSFSLLWIAVLLVVLLLVFAACRIVFRGAYVSDLAGQGKAP